MPHARPFIDVWQIDGKQKIAKFQIFHRAIVNPITCPIGLVSVHPSQPRVPKGCRVQVESEGTYGKATNHAQIRVKHHLRSKPREQNDLDKPKFEPTLTES